MSPWKEKHSYESWGLDDNGGRKTEGGSNQSVDQLQVDGGMFNLGFSLRNCPISHFCPKSGAKLCFIHSQNTERIQQFIPYAKVNLKNWILFLVHLKDNIDICLM